METRMELDSDMKNKIVTKTSDDIHTEVTLMHDTMTSTVEYSHACTANASDDLLELDAQEISGENGDADQNAAIGNNSNRLISTKSTKHEEMNVNTNNNPPMISPKEEVGGGDGDDDFGRDRIDTEDML